MASLSALAMVAGIVLLAIWMFTVAPMLSLALLLVAGGYLAWNWNDSR